MKFRHLTPTKGLVVVTFLGLLLISFFSTTSYLACRMSKPTHQLSYTKRRMMEKPHWFKPKSKEGEDSMPQNVSITVSAEERDRLANISVPLDEVVSRWENIWAENRGKNELEHLHGVLKEAQSWLQQRNQWLSRPESEAVLPCTCVAFSTMSRGHSWCEDPLNQAGDVATISGSNVCVLNDVCIDGGLHFSVPSPVNHSTKASERFQVIIAGQKFTGTVHFPKAGKEHEDHFDRFQHKLIMSKHHERWSRYGNDSTPSYSTVVLMAPTNGKHITHFMEPLGSLQAAVRDMMTSFSGREKCGKYNRHCFYPPSEVLFMKGAVTHNSWNEHILRVVLQDYDRVTPLQPFRDFWEQSKPLVNTKVCFDKVIIPGFYYGIWPSNADTTVFHKALDRYIETLKREDELKNAMEAKKKGPVNGTSSKNAKVKEHQMMEQSKGRGPPTPRPVATSAAHQPSKRNILLAKRTTKRQIVDWDNFERIVRTVAKSVDADVSTIQYGGHSFLEQAQVSRKADILISLHGADLTNMVFQKPNSVVIELNPFLFFENRFYEMATALGLHYMAWSCTTYRCAFGGVLSSFRALKLRDTSTEYDDDSGMFTNKKYGAFPWNWKGYPGTSCPGCNELACCGVLRSSYYGKLREGSIKIGPADGRHAKEIISVLYDAFRALNWRIQSVPEMHNSTNTTMEPVMRLGRSPRVKSMQPHGAGH